MDTHIQLCSCLKSKDHRYSDTAILYMLGAISLLARIRTPLTSFPVELKGV